MGGAKKCARKTKQKKGLKKAEREPLTEKKTGPNWKAGC